MRLKKMAKENTLEILCGCIPETMMYKNDKIFKKSMILAAWHYTHGLFNFKEECEKLTELLGPYDFKGTDIPEQEVEFFETQAIWGFYYEDVKNAVIVYLSEKGLCLELMESSEPFLEDIYDDLIKKLVIKEKLPDSF